MACLGVSVAEGLATGIAIGKAMRTTPETAGEPQRQRKSLLLASVADMEAASTGNLAQLTVSAAKQAQFSESLADLDSDGDMDIISVSRADHKVLWFENDGSQNFSPHQISDTSRGALSVFPEDLDGDGDLDLLLGNLGGMLSTLRSER